MININFCRWLDSKRGPLESEATTLPTVPQPLPSSFILPLLFSFSTYDISILFFIILSLPFCIWLPFLSSLFRWFFPFSLIVDLFIFFYLYISLIIYLVMCLHISLSCSCFFLCSGSSLCVADSKLIEF